MKMFALPIALAAVATAAAAAPPPPVHAPAELARPYEGYDLQPLFQIWRYHVEAKKGAAIDALLADRERLDGETASFAPLVAFKRYHDFGHYLSGEIRAWCRSRDNEVARETCHYRLRRGYVPFEAGDYPETNPVSEWMRRTFDPALLATHLKTAGFAPDTDWWRADRDRLFAAFPSPLPVLMDNATIVTLDSRDCPAMAEELEALDGQTLRSPLDFPRVGQDDFGVPPGPHATRTTYIVNVLGTGGGITIEDAGRDLHAQLKPLLAAMDDCEKKRR